MPNGRNNKRTVAKSSERNANGSDSVCLHNVCEWKGILIYTCFNGVLKREWIHIFKTVIEFVQVVRKLWYVKIESRNKMEGVGKWGGTGVADKDMMIQNNKTYKGD